VPKLSLPEDTTVRSQVRFRPASEHHSGGAWKVAYADFATAMMALFIVLWMMNTSQKVKSSISSYFTDPRAYAQKAGARRASNSGEGLVVDRNNMRDIRKQLEQALPYLERCLSLSRTTGKLRTAAFALTAIADINAKRGMRDLVRAVAKGGAAAFAEQVSAHMTPQPETCTEAETVESVMEAMTRGRFRHVPVLDEQMRLCGMISIGDVVKIRIAETVSEAAALRDYITATV